MKMKRRQTAISKQHLPSGPETRNPRLLNEEGIALVMVLALSAILLAIMAGLLLFAVSGTQVSGIQKRYKSAVDAGTAGATIAYEFIALRGDSASTNDFISTLNSKLSNSVDTSKVTSCSVAGYTYSGLAAKLNNRTFNTDGTLNWGSSCDRSLTVDSSHYDMKFDLGIAPTYTVYAKIVDTVEGNSGPDNGLINTGVVKEGTGQGKAVPYLYTVEIDAENATNPAERAKFSILYQY